MSKQLPIFLSSQLLITALQTSFPWKRFGAAVKVCLAIGQMYPHPVSECERSLSNSYFLFKHTMEGSCAESLPPMWETWTAFCALRFRPTSFQKAFGAWTSNQQMEFPSLSASKINCFKKKYILQVKLHKTLWKMILYLLKCILLEHEPQAAKGFFFPVSQDTGQPGLELRLLCTFNLVSFHHTKEKTDISCSLSI